MKKVLYFLLILIMSCGCLVGCAASNGKNTASGGKTYSRITMEQAKEKFAASNEKLMIVDVRRPDEYAEGHIPGAINIPNESIKDAKPQELPDINQVIYVYCRSGNRSRQAAEKLVALGYTNIIEFGGIGDWTGKIEK